MLFQEIINLLWKNPAYFAEKTFEHILISGTTILIIIPLGIGGGWLMYRSKGFNRILTALVNLIYTIPSIAMFGLLIPLLGLGVDTAITALCLYGLLPIIRNSCQALKEIDVSVIEAAKLNGCTAAQRFFHVELILALPLILTGIRTAMVMTIALTAVAAFIGAGGLGSVIWRGFNTNYTAMIFCGSAITALFAIIVDLCVSQLEKPVAQWAGR